MIQHHNYENKSLQQILETFSHYQKINFAFYCVKDVEHFTNDQRIIACNQIVEQWLNGDKTVDLITARTNALDAWNTTAYPAVPYAVADYAAAAVAAATNAPTNAANAATAANAANAASRAKSFNLHPNNQTQRNVAYKQLYQEYEQIAQNWLSHWIIPNFPKDEPDFPLFDYLIDYNLISSLLPKNDNFYYLNLNGFDIKHHNEAELLKTINTTHIKTILRRIINNDSAQQL